MALVTTRTDDLTGEPEAATFVVTVNGKGVELDLADKSEARLMKALEPFWKAGVVADYDVSRRARRRSAPAATNGDAPEYDIAALREWAAAHDVTLPARGRIPRAIVEHYLAAR